MPSLNKSGYIEFSVKAISGKVLAETKLLVQTSYRYSKFMMYFALLLVTLSNKDQEKEFLLKLKDGSAVYAKFESKKLAVKTDFGNLEISTSDIKSIRMIKESMVIKTQKSEITGNIDGDIPIKTNYGAFKIKACDIDEVVQSTRGFYDKSVVGFWDFNGDEDVKLHGGKYVVEDGKTAVELDLSKDQYFEIPHKDELSQKEAVTIEMRFKFKYLATPSTKQIDFLMKGQGYATDENYRIMVFPASKQFHIGSRTEKKEYPYSFHTITELSAEKWHYLVATFDAKNKKIDIYFDGKKFPDNYSLPFDGSAMNINKSPVFICKQKFDNNNTVWFDYIRISNRVRTEDEIKESVENLSFNNVKPPIVLTKTGESFSCKFQMEEIIISTEYGKMKIPLKDINSIAFACEETIVTTKSIIKGKIEMDVFELETFFGKIKLEKKQIHSIKLRIENK